ncbi:unnamed protein product [Staurois parvus]|uniref:Uncharacterized protein n=1 Tax=Staurois parvus TaxID=386267 RepID=A0ABN9A7P2_9NEOB|nr:unnamed protein product [Staurois parvus]
MMPAGLLLQAVGGDAPSPAAFQRPFRAVLCHRGNLRMQPLFLPADHRADWRLE